MKRKLTGLLCACLLLCGCQVGSDPTVSTQPQETTQPATNTIPLLEQGTALAESPNLRYIPNDALESMASPDLRLLGNGLLLSEYRDQKLYLNHISLEDGSLLSCAVMAAGEDIGITIGSGEIGITDRESGLVTILDESLQTLRTYPMAVQGESWFLNPELDILFSFVSDIGLVAHDLESGEERALVENGFQVTVLGSENGYVFFAYTDREDQKTYYRALDLATATVETLPMNGTTVSRQGEVWLLQRDSDHILILGEDSFAVNWTDSPVRLLSPRRHLLVMDASQRTLMLHDTEGEFLSQCVLPQSSHAAVGEDFVWSGYWDGYFFTDFLGGDVRLMFWDVNAATQGEALELVPLDEVREPQKLLEPALYDRAQEISDCYGVEIFIGEQCELVYTHFESYALTDPIYVREALDVLDMALSRYPDDFFRQLPFGTVETIRFEVVGALYAREGVTYYQNSVGAFAQHRDNYYGIVLDGLCIQEDTIYHEVSHIIDKKLAWDAQIRADALFSEERWMQLQPDGFQYVESYVDMPEEALAYAGSGYFIRAYSMRYPTEDRADVLAAAMAQEDWSFAPGTGLRAKLEFYAACIRDCFDTENWPDVVCWEQVLKDGKEAQMHENG